MYVGTLDIYLVYDWLSKFEKSISYLIRNGNLLLW
jgi:hypothetical protein